MRRWLAERLTDLLVWDVETVEKITRGGAEMVEKTYRAIVRRSS